MLQVSLCMCECECVACVCVCVAVSYLVACDVTHTALHGVATCHVAPSNWNLVTVLDSVLVVVTAVTVVAVLVTVVVVFSVVAAAYAYYPVVLAAASGAAAAAAVVATLSCRVDSALHMLPAHSTLPLTLPHAAFLPLSHSFSLCLSRSQCLSLSVCVYFDFWAFVSRFLCSCCTFVAPSTPARLPACLPSCCCCSTAPRLSRLSLFSPPCRARLCLNCK